MALVFALQVRPAYAAAIEPLPGCITNTLPANDDGSTGAVDLGFSANFFNATYTSLFINNNGNVTFNGPLSAFTPQPLVEAGVPIIAPFWADVDTSGPLSSVLSYGQTTFDGHPALCADWEGTGVGYYAGKDDKLNKFQLLIVGRADVGAGDFDIVFNYDQVQWETGDASGGSGGLGGSSARAGYSNGNPLTPDTSYELPGSAVNGAFLDSNADTGLINHSHASDVLGRYVYPVRNGTPVSGTADLSASITDNPDPVTAGETLRYTVTVSNAGPDPANNVQLTDTLPSGVTFIGATVGCTESAGTVSCPLGQLGTGNSTEITIDVSAPSTAPADPISDDAFVSADEDPSGATASESTTVQDPAAAPDDGSGFATGQTATTVQTQPDGLQFSSITVPAGITDPGPVSLHETEGAPCLPGMPSGCIGEELRLVAPAATQTNPLRLSILVAKASLPATWNIKQAVMYHLLDNATSAVQVLACGKKPRGIVAPELSCLQSVKAMRVGGVPYIQFLILTEVNGRWRG
jgi:uncharacterized repeat protein (TIGR01451 family)